MKILIIVASYKMDNKFNKTMETIQKKLISVLKKENNIVDICLVSSHNDHNNYKNIIGEIKYKVLSNKKQFGKIMDIFKLSEIKEYDWYIKIRPDIELYENIDTEKILSCDENKFNSRVRWYIGDHINVKYGTSHTFNKNDGWGESWIYNNNINYIVPDDQIYIFNKNIINIFNIFNINSIKNKIDNIYRYNYYNNPNNKWRRIKVDLKSLLNSGYNKLEDEWFHGDLLRYNGVQINPIGLNVKLYVNSNDLIV